MNFISCILAEVLLEASDSLVHPTIKTAVSSVVIVFLEFFIVNCLCFQLGQFTRNYTQTTKLRLLTTKQGVYAPPSPITELRDKVSRTYGYTHEKAAGIYSQN